MAALGLGLRLAALTLLTGPPEAFEYEELAANLLAGRGYVADRLGTPYLSLHSAVPYVLLKAAVYGLTGHRHLLFFIVHPLLSAILVLAVHRLGPRL